MASKIGTASSFSGAGVKRPATNSSSSSVVPSDPRETPSCLKRLVRTIVRSFYSREHSLIMDMLVRNTIMKEDDLCERLRFEKKQLRQYLRALEKDQFIKSKLQLETDADGKTSKITHYFIDYKLFVNIVKYRLDQMQRRLEAEQRQTSSRALFKCLSCNNAYTDLEVDRLFDPTAGGLVCVYCRSEVKEEEDNTQRSDARALVAKFHQKVREPLDAMLKECDRVHLSSSMLEPEIRALEPLPGQEPAIVNPEDVRHQEWLNGLKRSVPLTQQESTVTIVLGGSSNSSANTVTKERPVWMSESTITNGAGLGELDRGTHVGGGGSLNLTSSAPTVSNGEETITQTLAPGRVPTAAHDTDGSRSGNSGGGGSGSVSGGSQSQSTSGSGDIMQLLLVHERRGLSSHGPRSCLTKSPATPAVKSSLSQSCSILKNDTGDSKSNEMELNSNDSHSSSKPPIASSTSSHSNSLPASSASSPLSSYTVVVADKVMPFTEVTPAMIKTLTPSETEEYMRVGRRLYSEIIVD